VLNSGHVLPYNSDGWKIDSWRWALNAGLGLPCYVADGAFYAPWMDGNTATEFTGDSFCSPCLLELIEAVSFFIFS
jgi:hypothetical protein